VGLSQTKQPDGGLIGRGSADGAPGRRRPVAVWRLLDAYGHISEDDNMPIDLKPFLPEEDDIIFVVEGDEVVRSALHFILDDQNETHSFTTLDLAFSKAGDLAPSLVLLGVDLLRHDGELALAEVARQLPGVKILIVADSTRDPLAQRSLKWGAHDVLGKPISFDSVRRGVDALLRRQQASVTMLGLLPPSAAW
jgi:CheY-like chemotaxis protein